MKETELIKERYDRRKVEVSEKGALYSKFIADERNLIYKEIINKYFSKKDSITFLEIGAGSGSNIDFFKTLLVPKNISANELLQDRIIELKNNHPDIKIYSGNALEIDTTLQFDIVFQSTVFTSILDSDFRVKLADKMWNLTKPGGIVIWYDFIYDNPKNSDVKKVSVKELKSLFTNGNFTFGKKVTLAPPIGRRVGKLYSFFNLFTFLRSHFIAVIQKK